jgi:hypothetical protein
MLYSYPGELPDAHELTLRIHAGVEKEVLVHEGVTTGPGASFECSVDLTGNAYVEVRNGDEKIADCWFNTWFVGRRTGEVGDDCIVSCLCARHRGVFLLVCHAC